MQGREVYEVLKQIGATSLHHANTVTTSSTFLELGALVSRGFVEDRGLQQTMQSSDQIDKKYGIWHCIFVDHVDIHHRAGRTKGPNQYGPVLFLLDLEILLGLPEGSGVFITKKNPVNWIDGEPDTDRWFENKDQLAAEMRFGDFGKMLVIQTPSGMLNFPDREVRINLDNPQRSLSSGEDAYTHAYNRLSAAAATGKVGICMNPPNCNSGCACIGKYASYDIRYIDRMFA
jgi:hypothetical protein